MRLFIRLAFAVILLGCLVAAAGAGERPSPMQAQAQPKLDTPKQGYAELEAAARKLLAAYASGDADKLFDVLAVPRRNSVALGQARQVLRFEEKPERFEKYLKRAAVLDPAGKLKLKTLDDYRNLRPAEFFALSTGMIRAASLDLVAKRLKEHWFMVEREIMLTGLRTSYSGTIDFVTRGAVTFENVSGDKIEVTCMPDDDGWRMTTFDVKVADFHKGFSGSVAGGGVQSNMDEAAMSEARAALGALKDRARVVYQRTVRAPASLQDLGIGDEELRGSFFDADCYKITNTDVRNWTVTCKPKDADGPVLAVVADLIQGRSQFFEYADEDELADNPPKLEEKK